MLANILLILIGSFLMFRSFVTGPNYRSPDMVYIPELSMYQHDYFLPFFITMICVILLFYFIRSTKASYKVLVSSLVFIACLIYASHVKMSYITTHGFYLGQLSARLLVAVVGFGMAFFGVLKFISSKKQG